MIILRDCNLHSCYTVRLHSMADVLHFLESRQELTELSMDYKLKEQAYYVFSGGSNIIFAERMKTPLICWMSLDKGIDYIEDKSVKVGCSVRIQTLIRNLQNHGLGGIEYLFSVPTSIEGAM